MRFEGEWAELTPCWRFVSEAIGQSRAAKRRRIFAFFGKKGKMSGDRERRLRDGSRLENLTEILRGILMKEMPRIKFRN